MHFTANLQATVGRARLGAYVATWIALAAFVVTACSARCPPGTIESGNVCRSESSLMADAGLDPKGQPEASGSGATSPTQAGAGGTTTATMGAGTNSATGAGGSSGTRPPAVVAGSSSTAGMAGQPGSVAGSGAGPAPMTSGPCPAGVTPAAETCDGQDNDCDGHVDEDLTDMACGSSMQGLCHMGKASCIAGKWTECVGAVEPMPEVCDPSGLDENCNGMSNEGCACTPGKTQPCGMDGGICKMGTQSCSADATWGTDCNGAVLPQTEICDGKQDEDCDGLLDAQDPDCACINGKSESCVAGRGVCAMGTRTCNNGKWSDCRSVTGPQTETCDGIDTDCDGSPDNNAVCPNGQVCSNGHCVCSEGSHMNCTVTSAKGPCAAGTQTCQGGKWGTCTSSVMAKAETCGDGVDNNCDGMIDECPSGQACSMGACVPNGSYLASCNQCSLSGTTLTCQACTDSLGKPHVSSLTGLCSDIQNCFGQLNCVGCLEQLKQQGSFDDTCTNCVTTNKTLACDCKDTNDMLQHTETWDLPCPGGLYNDNGALKCAK
jgi:hypothetical protein